MESSERENEKKEYRGRVQIERDRDFETDKRTNRHAYREIERGREKEK